MKKSSKSISEFPIDSQKLPVHIGIIMDGNGRWAKQRGMSRTQGHKQGLETAKEIVKKAAELGIPYVTLYAFSTENWKRTADEVGFLMSLIKTHLRAELTFYIENCIRVRHIGNLETLPPEIVSEILWVVNKTAQFDKTTVVLAINYGGQNEIIRAIKKMDAHDIKIIDEKNFNDYLDIPDLPPMDLLIRTAGEQRISNFLLWQSAYAELYFSDLLWPDWKDNNLVEAIYNYQARDRRFGNNT